MDNSNLYAERVFAEHPLGLWPLDDDIAFIQLLSGSAQLLTNWSHAGMTNGLTAHSTTQPLPDAPSSQMTLSSSANLQPSISSPFTIAVSTFSDMISTACFSMHVYHESVFLEGIRIGVKYGSTDSYSDYVFNNADGWQAVSHTFDIPDTGSVSFYVQPTFSTTGSLIDRALETSAVSVGQWSESYLYRSHGVVPVTLTSDLSSVVNYPSSYKYISADAYGLDSSINGAYLTNGNSIYVKNAGIPLAFGSSQVTSVFAAPNGNPSILIPAFGLLNTAGQYNDYTLEAWIRMDNLAKNPTRIIGNPSSSDGIYVEEGFISLRIGPYVKSYFVGKWYRPMLMHFKYSQTLCSLLINGEEVISMPIDLANITFSASDWIGIYGNADIKPFEIDCLGIYPYQLPLEMAKRRFVYGQGVHDSDLSSQQYLSNNTQFDYAYSEYSSNMIYPDMSVWRTGNAINLDSTSSYLTTPKYELPTVQIKKDSRLLSEFDWFYANKQVNDTSPETYPFVQIRPYYEYGTWESWTNIWGSGANVWNGYLSTTWDDVSVTTVVNDGVLYSDVSIHYNSVNMLAEKLASVCGTFKSPVSPLDEQIIFSLTNKSSGDRINATLRFNTLYYIFQPTSGNESVLMSNAVADDTVFPAGFDIDYVSRMFRSTVGSFFSNLDNVSLNIGGYFDQSFGGKIFNVHFSNRFFHNKDLDAKFSNGFIVGGSVTTDYLLDYVANYSLIPVEQDTIMALDIGVAGYWEDFQPLSYFGKTVVDSAGDQYYDLDMLQINMDTGKKSALEVIVAESLLYGELSTMFATYDDLSNILLTGWENYNAIVGASAAYSAGIDASVTAYLTFQKYYEAGTKQYSAFTSTTSLDYSNVIEFSEADYKTNKYELMDNTIVLTPASFKDYYIGLHLEFRVRGILQKNMLLRRLEVASLAFDDSAPYKIGTKHSLGVYPFTRSDYQFSYKHSNPVTIYKESSPYLYLTEYSGIFVNPFDSRFDRGVLVPINPDKQIGYSVGAIQWWQRYPYENFPTVPFKISNFSSETEDIDFYLVPDADGSRAFLHAYDTTTNAEFTELKFFQNGYPVERPVVYPREWSAINISFDTPIAMSYYTGRIELYSGMVFNNINEYSFDHESPTVTTSTYSKWYNVYVDPLTELVQTWDAATDTYTLTWRAATATVTDQPLLIDGSYIYDNQTGVAVSVTEDLSMIKVFSNGSDTMTDVVWQTFEVTPV